MCSHLYPSCLGNAAHGLHWLSLAAALPCQHVRHRHPLEHCFTQLMVTCRKNHKAIIQEGAVSYRRCPKFPPQAPQPQEPFSMLFPSSALQDAAFQLESCSWKKTDAFGSSGYVPSLPLEWFPPHLMHQKQAEDSQLDSKRRGYGSPVAYEKLAATGKKHEMRCHKKSPRVGGGCWEGAARTTWSMPQFHKCCLSTAVLHARLVSYLSSPWSCTFWKYFCL